MKWFLFVIIFSDGGGRVFYERKYEMPGLEECVKAASATISDVKLSETSKRGKAGAVLYCAGDKVEATHEQ